MTYSIGVNCEIILDGQGYFIKANSYTVKQPRIRKAQYRADGSLSYVDIGPGKRTWTMVILCLNNLVKYDGTQTGLTGEQYRDALRSSYTGNIATTINFTDPLSGTAIPVYFDSYEETIIDLHSQIVAVSTGSSAGASYDVKISLQEA